MLLAGLQHYLLALAKLIGSGFSLESPAQCTLGESLNQFRPLFLATVGSLSAGRCFVLSGVRLVCVC